MGDAAVLIVECLRRRTGMTWENLAGAGPLRWNVAEPLSIGGDGERVIR
jgi:hypothetical protein